MCNVHSKICEYLQMTDYHVCKILELIIILLFLCEVMAHVQVHLVHRSQGYRVISLIILLFLTVNGELQSFWIWIYFPEGVECRKLKTFWKKTTNTKCNNINNNEWLRMKVTICCNWICRQDEYSFDKTTVECWIRISFTGFKKSVFLCCLFANPLKKYWFSFWGIQLALVNSKRKASKSKAWNMTIVMPIENALKFKVNNNNHKFTNSRYFIHGWQRMPFQNDNSRTFFISRIFEKKKKLSSKNDNKRWIIYAFIYWTETRMIALTMMSFKWMILSVTLKVFNENFIVFFSFNLYKATYRYYAVDENKMFPI